ncbi:MAG: phosphoribosylformylglycinamidine synthase, partial [Sediminibacterium sp.]|nr:phosphoribosylformylglycinamidine synthase [Sediminibacterium sp.]
MKKNSFNRIFIEKKNIFNTQAITLLNTIKIQLNIHSLLSVRIFDIYDIVGINQPQMQHCIDKILVNPVTDMYVENIEIANADVFFAVSLLPAQYNQRNDNAEQCFQILYPSLKVQIISAKGYIFKGDLTSVEVNKIKHFLINAVDSYEIDFFISTPFSFKKKIVGINPIKGFIHFSKKKLNEFCIKEGYSFSEADILFIQQYFKKENENPTSIALKTIETYWSDHCRHTTFNTEITNIIFPTNQWGKLFQQVYSLFLSHQESLKKTSKTTLMRLATVFAQYKKSKGQLSNVEFSDEINACSIFVDLKLDNKKEKWLIQFKNETHNHPTEIEPFGGAATCLGGAIRDPLSGRSFVYQAMRISGSANPTENIADTITGKLPQFIISTEAANGFSSYGNQIGIATTFVKEIFHPGYKAKRMEVGVVVGASPYKNIKRQKPQAGDIVILLGGKTGKDGIGGAVGSSKSHHKDSTIQSFSEVQKGNAIEERKLQRFYKIPAVAKKIKKSNDFGAGGVAVAVGELADGIDIFLDRIPLKYAGLSPQEILLSESQERMAIVIDKKHVSYIIDKAKEENIDATAIAAITNKEKMVVYWHNQIILSLKRDFLNTNGVTPKIEIHIPTYKNDHLLRSNIKNGSFNSFIKQLSIASQKGLTQQFDSTIGATTVLMPFGGKTQLTPAQSSVQLVQTFEKKTNTCTVLSYGFDPHLSDDNPFLGAVYANVEAISKMVSTGANYKNIHFSYQEYFEKLGTDFTKWAKPFLALLGAYHIQSFFNLAAIGGKDSMSGTFQNIAVPPTLIAFGLATENVENVISPEFKRSKNYIYLFNYEVDSLGLPNFTQLKNNYN